MARRCGCAADSCACYINPTGNGIKVSGSGSQNAPFVIDSTVADIETGIDIQQNNSTVLNNVHGIDFRGNGVVVSAGTDEVIVTITDTTGGGGTGTPVPPGVLTMFAGVNAPAEWMLCQGQTLLIADQPNLFAAIGNFYGGDGTTNFKVPDLRGLAIIGVGPSNARTGLPAGAVNNQVTIGTPNLPPHAHSIPIHQHSTPDHTHPGIKVGGTTLMWKDNQIRFDASASLSAPASSGNQNITVSSGGAGLTNFTSASDTGNGPGTGTALNIAPRHMAMNYIIKL